MEAGTTASERSAAATIEFERVSKRFDREAIRAGAGGAVEELSLTVPAGRICVLVGPSGCGKTTTLKMVNRLVDPTSGRILLDGQDVASRHVTELRRGIGYVIQQVGLFPHQTIAQNVATVPRLLGWPVARQRARSEELLATVGLDPARYCDRYPSQLSGGERQRVGVARALAADPPVMLMDEPFGAVDPIVRERLQNELLRLQEELAKTILFVTHDIDEAIKMGDLVVVMQQGGRIAQAGAPSDLLVAPASEYVARFVGADRGLKRLSLFRVSDVPLEDACLVRAGDDAVTTRQRLRDEGVEYALLVDHERRPVGWIAQADIPGAGSLDEGHGDPESPILDPRTTLKDATSMLLAAEVQTGVVVDRGGRVLGLVTLDAVMSWMRDDRSREVPEDIAAAAAEAVTIADGEAPGA
ncbi:betaine/proline/choline family ABC transporter ATP-binding protein [soil metagenome]